MLQMMPRLTPFRSPAVFTKNGRTDTEGDRVASIAQAPRAAKSLDERTNSLDSGLLSTTRRLGTCAATDFMKSDPLVHDLLKKIGPFFVLVLPLFGCGDHDPVDNKEDDRLKVTVTIDTEQVLRIVPPYAYGMHASVYDNALQDPALKEELDGAGIALLRWPGGGYSDNYHWATHTMSAWSNGQRGYLAPETDFGNFVRMLDRVERVAMITVNYGSNQYDDGPGEPKEAAAWVAYANGDPADETVIGEDSTGFDWQTVGYWAGLRASEPLPADDGFNPLRIHRPEPLGIEYWEIGNEVFGNGYYQNGGNDGFELDLHVPYDGTPRRGHEDLSPRAYGAGVREFVAEMKAVDPSIKVGAVLVTPPADYSWAPTYNRDVLSECGEEIDFGIIHWYPQGNLLTKPAEEMEVMFETLRAEFEAHAGDNAENLEITVTEVGPPPGYSDKQASVSGLFAADAYLSFIRHGASNIDWLELHNGTFLHEESDEPGRAYYGIKFAHDLAGPGERIVAAEADQPGVRVHAGVREDGSLAVMLINPAVFRVSEVTIVAHEASQDATIRSFSSSQSRTPDSVKGPEALQKVDGQVIVTVGPETLVLIEFTPA